MELVLPLPPKELSPNARLHHFPKASAVAHYRSDVYYLAVAAREEFVPLQDRLTWMKGRKRLTETYRFADRRKRDVRNLFAAFKAGEDGLVDAGLLPGDDDSVLLHGSPSIERVKTKAEEGVVVMIEEILR
jgi:crossover junction endodeoxyribonuclease RusA